MPRDSADFGLPPGVVEDHVELRLLERRINELLSGITLADLMHQEAQIYQIVGVAAGT